MWAWVLLHKIASSPSKTLTWILAFFCLGVLVAPFFLSFSSYPFLFAALLALLAGSVLRPNRRLLVFACACIAFGIFRYQQSFFPPNLTTVADRVGITTRVEATVSSDVEHRLSRQQAIVSQVRLAGESVEGKLLVHLPLYPSVRYGDQLAFSCALARPGPIDGFAYDRQLAARGVLAVCAFPQYVTVNASQTTLIGSILAVRDHLIARLQSGLPEPHVSFVSGLLFGGSSSLSPALRDDFSRTGLSHILAASGFNLSLFSVVLLGILLQSPFGRRRGLVLTGIFLLVYVVIAGGTPAVVRSALMAGVLIIQKGIGRQASSINLLLLALAIMLLVNPKLLLDDVGFQLSFVATASLLFIHPRVEHWFHVIPEDIGIRTAITSSVVAIIFTLPILLWHFGSVSLFAPIANAIVLPFVPLLMALGMMALFGGIFFALPAYGLSFVLLRMTQALSAVPLASLTVVHARLFAVLIAGCLIGWIFYDRYVTASRKTCT